MSEELKSYNITYFDKLVLESAKLGHIQKYVYRGIVKSDIAVNFVYVTASGYIHFAIFTDTNSVSGYDHQPVEHCDYLHIVLLLDIIRIVTTDITNKKIAFKSTIMPNSIKYDTIKSMYLIDETTDLINDVLSLSTKCANNIKCDEFVDIIYKYYKISINCGKKHIRELGNALEQSNVKFDNMKAVYVDLVANHNVLKVAYDKLTAIHSEIKDEHHKLKVTNNAHNELKDTYHKLETTYNDLKVTCSNLKAERDSFKITYEDLLTRYSGLTYDHNNLKDMFYRTKSNHDNSLQDIEMLTEEIKHLNAKADEHDQLKTELDKLHKAMNNITESTKVIT